jgi:hypothetical protein
MTTMASAAIQGLNVTCRNGIVRVRDGQDTWLCTAAAWDAAVAKLDAKPADSDDENGAEAYGALCSEVADPVATAIGGCRGEWRALVRRAIEAGLVDADDAARLYGVA